MAPLAGQPASAFSTSPKRHKAEVQGQGSSGGDAISRTQMAEVGEASELVPPPPPPVPSDSVRQMRLCVKGFRRINGFGCPCCDWDVPPRLAGSGGAATSRSLGPPPLPPSLPMASMKPASGRGARECRFVDTHCHLEDVLQLIRRHETVPSMNKNVDELTSDEMQQWRSLGWVKSEGLDADSGGDAAPESTAGEDAAASSSNSIWERRWTDLSQKEREAVEKLGYTPDAWNKSQWLLPRSTAWKDLAVAMRQALETLGETEAGWEGWTSGGGSSSGMIVNSNDLRQWSALTAQEQRAAKALGFSETTWNTEEVADIDGCISSMFGAGFEGCITQGCDADSVDGARNMALSHPKVWVSFGCHPKSAWSYDDALEKRFVECARECGTKTVAWGEFGLDYSHPHYGRVAENRRKQKNVFARQLDLAVSLGYPLVIHSRAADRDTLRMMRAKVPRHWKVHIHSFRGSIQFMEAMLAEYPNAFIGLPGIVTMNDVDAQELCRRCPLEKTLLETDSPYLPIAGHFYSHPGLIPEIIETVAKLKNISEEEVAFQVRENARKVYGI